MLHGCLQRLGQRLPKDQQNPRGFIKALLLPAHTHLFVLSFLLFWYFHRQYVASLDHVVVAGALISGIFGCLRAMALSWLGDVHKSALAASLLCLFLLFFNDLRGALAESYQALHLPFESHLSYDLVLFSLLFAAVIAWVMRTRRSLVRASQAVEIFSLALVAMVGIQILAFKPLPPASSAIPELAGLPHVRVSTNVTRDIYLIILDSRTSSAALSRYWHYDDSAFTAGLKQLGFQCASNAVSEYSATPHCISTLMNMETPVVPSNLQPRGIVSYLARTIRDSRVADFLSRQGYGIVNLSLFDLRDQPRFYAYFERGSYFSIFAATLPGVFWRDYLNRAYLWRADEALLSELSQLPARDAGGPKFVYAHLMMPHGPFLYDRNGKLKPSGLFLNNKNDSGAYLEQLIYTDTLILKTVRTILTTSRTPPIILIRGDHGFRFLPPPDRDHESCQTFFAAYFPDAGTPAWLCNVSHAEVFREVFNHYFGTSIPLDNSAGK